MARYVHYTKLFAFGSESDIESFKNRINEMCDENKEIAGVAHDDFESGVDINQSIESPKWIEVHFQHYTIRCTMPDYYKEFLQEFPDLVFVAVGNYDTSLMRLGYGFDWFFAKDGIEIDSGKDEIDGSDWDDDDEDRDFWDEAFEKLQKRFTKRFNKWVKKNQIIEKLGDTGKDETFLAGLTEIVRMQAGK